MNVSRETNDNQKFIYNVLCKFRNVISVLVFCYVSRETFKKPSE